MKKALLAAALMSAGVIAHAQSSVTLFGRLDAGVEYMSGIPSATGTGSTSRVKLESGDWGTSLWGMKGVEDLGGGLSAVFHLEGSFSTATGALGGPNNLFNRYALVGIQDNQVGTLTLGRELTLDGEDLWAYDPFAQSSWSSASLVRGRNWQASSNNINFDSQTFGGFAARVQYSLGNTTNFNDGATGNGGQLNNEGRSDAVELKYNNSLLQLRAVYDEVRNVNGGLGDTTNGVWGSSREYMAGGNVILGPFTLNAMYDGLRSSGVSGAPTGIPTTANQEYGGVTWHATPAAQLIAAVYHVNANNGAGNATMYTIGGSYNLSKRTLLDVQVATVRNSNNADFSLEANLPGNSDNPLPGHSQSGVYAGIEHSF
ncbi:MULTISPECIES: porin [Paraburkholderia]|uniref:Outer membrane protein (Porin) n=1 Tax=Paraburkholderia phenazinium TaxID=60549 RepID=A0A1N6FAY9_9BURK|nr:porin [Paraburkholderia phenazinium]SIN92356.1 Outer membrane protein (porin) [Paraburkholderia phenazinium]